MKKVYFLLAFCFAIGMATANAQACQASAGATKSCCAAKVAKAAAADPAIEKRQAEDGTVSYVRKETDTQGNVKFVSVQFDESNNAFVNVAPKSLTAGEKATMTKKTASCAATAGGEKKACCASGASKKACAGEKAEKTSMTTNQQ